MNVLYTNKPFLIGGYRITLLESGALFFDFVDNKVVSLNMFPKQELLKHLKIVKKYLRKEGFI